MIDATIASEPVLQPAPTLPERPAPRANLAQSRTIWGASIAAASQALDQAIPTLLEVVQQAAQMAQPLDQVAPVFHTIFVYSTLAGIFLTAYARWDDHRSGRR